MAKRKKTHVEGELLQELIEDAYSDFTKAIAEAKANIEISLPNLIFQEKHTSGWLWWKRTWYTYHRYSEGSMIGLSQYSHMTISSTERGK